MRRESLRARLRRMEAKSPTTDAILHFPNGSTRGIRVKNRLQLLIDSFDRARAFPPKGPDGEVMDPVPEPRDGPYSSVLDLMENAERVEGDDRLLRTVHGICRGIGELRKESSL